MVEIVVATKKETLLRLEKTEYSELDELITCSKTAFLSNQEEVELHNDDLEWYQQKINENELYSVFYGEKLIGGTILRKSHETLIIERLFIHPNYHNKNLDKKLIKQIEKMFESFSVIELYAPLVNQKINDLYQSLQYRIVNIDNKRVYYRKDIHSKRFFKGNQFIFMPQDSILKELVNLVELCNHQVLVKWTFQQIDKLLSEQHFDSYIVECVQSAKLWAQGSVKMNDTKPMILHCHQLAKKQNNILIAAIAQGCSVVHTPKHAMGLVLYELSWIYKNKNYQDVLNKIEEYVKALQKIKNNHIDNQGKWATFLRI